jgi:hypothetical protein
MQGTVPSAASSAAPGQAQFGDVIAAQLAAVQPGPPARSNQLIADAPVRSMLGSFSPTGSMTARFDGPSKSIHQQLPEGTSVVASRQRPATKAELAFSLRLTPIDAGSKSSRTLPATPSAKGDWTPVVMASIANAGDCPGPLAAPAERAPQTAAEALRASEPGAPPNLTPPSCAAQEIALRIALPDAPPVDILLVERAGQVQVAVRTPDAGLLSSLRQDLGTLVNSLERSGYRAETFTPQDEAPLNNGRQRDPGSGEPGDPSGKHGARNQDGRQPPQQRQGGRQTQDWIEIIENAA